MSKKLFCTESLKCILTDSELLVYANAMAEASNKKSELEDNLKSVSSQFKAYIAKEEAVIQSKATRIRDKYEFREVKCRIEYDIKTTRVHIYRIDTNELVKSREMTEEEAMPDLPLK